MISGSTPGSVLRVIPSSAQGTMRCWGLNPGSPACKASSPVLGSHPFKLSKMGDGGNGRGEGERANDRGLKQLSIHLADQDGKEEVTVVKVSRGRLEVGDGELTET